MSEKSIGIFENRFGKIDKELMRQYKAGEISIEQLFQLVSAGEGKGKPHGGASAGLEVPKKGKVFSIYRGGGRNRTIPPRNKH